MNSTFDRWSVVFVSCMHGVLSIKTNYRLLKINEQTLLLLQIRVWRHCYTFDSIKFLMLKILTCFHPTHRMCSKAVRIRFHNQPVAQKYGLARIHWYDFHMSDPIGSCQFLGTWLLSTNIRRSRCVKATTFWRFHGRAIEWAWHGGFESSIPRKQACWLWTIENECFGNRRAKLKVKIRLDSL